ncbi:coenzyme F430 synthase [Methanoculleus sp. FWC-SCC1]|uniref:Coenzyme F430 synthase n=1 Tax=Methanoculleus frigidifontis TaxID=2584085 RepID=A0ABT8MDG9_9EURY|nr:coenzyme F430 synthase [Methanoculleus sp. FWC-SCC1]MDN7025995.1 coenzyme F430 synthase [Methanoculleus sp. FWC-SCC1]
MRLLVLDTIHGGAEIAAALRSRGHEVDAVDVYRGEGGISVSEALAREYDCVTAPVHLDPDHPLLRPDAVSHHEAVGMLLRDAVPSPMIEVTGARGKTTTAHALAHLMPGAGILHTSAGTRRCPDGEVLWRRSITPASVIPAAEAAGGWLIAEESLGVTAAGDVAVLTSADDYRIAAGKKSALAEKCRSLSRAKTVVVPPGVTLPGAVRAEEAVSFAGMICRYDCCGIAGAFANPLCTLAGYKTPLMMAAATACVLGIDPAPLADFAALPGRMASRVEDGVLIVDNANSGTNVATTVEAARYARSLSGEERITLVIGVLSQTVCEGFPAAEVERAVALVRPDRVVYTGSDWTASGRSHTAADLAEGLALARSLTDDGSIVLAVKTWR